MQQYKIVLLRHGESLWNAQNKFTGWIDVELSELGLQQAKKAGELLKENKFSFDVVFASALKRSIQTAEIVLQETGNAKTLIEKNWQLNERHYGLLQGMDKQEAVEKFGIEQVMAFRRSYKTRPPALDKQEESIPLTESLEDVYLRVQPFWLEKIAPLVLQGKSVLVSAHGNSLRALIKMLDCVSDQEIEKLNIPTGVPLVYVLDENLKPITHYYLGNEQDIEKAIGAVKNQIK